MQTRRKKSASKQTNEVPDPGLLGEHVHRISAASTGRKVSKARSSSSNREASDEKPDWRRDKWSIALLLLLYFLQGLPFGLSGTLDLTMQEGARLTYEEQGIYSSVSWPYSLKMLWAPIVDALFIKRFGRRKTWLVPTQLLIGVMLLLTADSIPALLGEGPEPQKPQVYQLTVLFFGFFFLCATQDIAVDGWALEILSKGNIGWASTCNSIGLTAGYTVSFQGFMALKSFGVCDFPQFMKVSGWAFLIVTALVAIIKKEAPAEEAPESIGNAYLQSWRVLQLSSVKMLMLALVTRSLTFSASDTLTTRKLLGMGMKKEMIATVAALLMPLSVVLPGMLTRYTNDKPLALFIQCYIPRMCLAVCSCLLVVFCPPNLASEEAPQWFWLAVIGLSIVASVVTTAQFVSLMAFFARVSDPLVGGSYMTTLNTATNLGSKWPNTAVLFLVNQLTWKECSLDGTLCRTVVDGYYILTGLCLVYGVWWISFFGKRLYKLEALKEKAWRVPRERTAATNL
jgi:PAT family acetyl-CoA transporter-like MFS transporter 1